MARLSTGERERIHDAMTTAIAHVERVSFDEEARLGLPSAGEVRVLAARLRAELWDVAA